MFTLCLGPDDFSKKQYVDALAAKDKAQVVVFSFPDQLPMGELLGGDLFGGKKVFIVFEAIKLLEEKNLHSLIETSNQIFFFENKLDKRVKFYKDLTANKQITVRDFPLPHGSELNLWIQHRVIELGGVIEHSAIEALAVALGRDEARETKFGGKVVETEELFSLWQTDSEIKKLLAYADGHNITEQMVKELVENITDASALDIVNALGEKNRQKTFNLLVKFLQGESAADEKGKIIQLNAILAEQFRNVALVQDFLKSGAGEGEIIKQTGWKSGRVYIMKKIAAQFDQKKVLDTLAKLHALDEELKSSGTPPGVLMNLIVTQLLI